MKVGKEMNQSRSVMGADLQTVKEPPGIELPGLVPSTYPLEPGPLDVWISRRGEPPGDYRHGSRLTQLDVDPQRDDDASPDVDMEVHVETFLNVDLSSSAQVKIQVKFNFELF